MPTESNFLYISEFLEVEAFQCYALIQYWRLSFAKYIKKKRNWVEKGEWEGMSRE